MKLKPLLILIRIIAVGLFWSIFFLEGIRIIMLQNWDFDIFNVEHWLYAWNLWLNGWIIDDPKEWAFILIIITFLPLWLTGWAALSVISWEKIVLHLLAIPLALLKKYFLKPVKIIKNTAIQKTKKKKSYKEIRPRSIGVVLDDSYYKTGKNNKAPTPSLPKEKTPLAEKETKTSVSAPAKIPSFIEAESKPENEGTFDHSLFQFDDDDDFEFNIDAYDTTPEEKSKTSAKAPVVNKKENNKSAPKAAKKENTENKKVPTNSKKSSIPNNTEAPNRPTKPANTTLDVLKQKGYEVLTATTIKSTIIDFIGISNDQINLCLIDKENGDWLADEERFNDEEPLWFSESSHRVSPVRKVDLARQELQNKLTEAGMDDIKINAFVIIQMGNIINAEDMFEIWNNMNIFVTRIDRGSPKELKLFAKAVDDVSSPLDKEKGEKLKKIIRNIA